MKVVFKCQKCNKILTQDLLLQGLFVAKCSCGSVYMDCLNLEECLKELKKNDI